MSAATKASRQGRHRRARQADRRRLGPVVGRRGCGLDQCRDPRSLGHPSARDVVEVPDDDAIPPGWFEDLAEIVAQTCARDYGRPKDQPERAERTPVKKGT
jgi:hypothetical protein